MSLISYFTGMYLNLPPREARKVVFEKDHKVPLPDGSVLLTDRYYPQGAEDSPVILVRSLYGRRLFFGSLYGRVFAERGFQVLLQSTRGTYGSGGELMPLVFEKDDGLATVRWLKEQEWFPGQFGTLGPSYLGFTQWAIARDAGPELKAISPQISASNFYGMGFEGGSLALDTAMGWAYFINKQDTYISISIAFMLSPFKYNTAKKHLPLNTLDKMALGKQLDSWQLLLAAGDIQDEGVRLADYSDTVPEVIAPVSMQGGWYDIFLPGLIKDFEMLADAGQQPQMIIGPWNHLSIQGAAAGLKDSFNWMTAQLRGDRSRLRKAPIKLFVMGAKEWRDFFTWPPEKSRPERWHLQSGGGLSTGLPAESEPDRYRYDPANPTPSVGGPVLFKLKSCVNNCALEGRSDVLVYTTDVLESELEIIGNVKAELYVSSSLGYTDFYARLCDVYPSGKSMNICEGIQRLRPEKTEPDADGIMRVDIELWPTAYRFLRGHRVRLQVSSGAHPRFARNPGSGEPLGSATTLCIADQEVYHDPKHPSTVILPVIERNEAEEMAGKSQLIFAKCIWCNGEAGSLEEMNMSGQSNFDSKPREEIVSVHPEHELSARRFLTRMDKLGNWFLFGLILNLLLSSVGLVVSLSVADWNGYGIILGLTIMALGSLFFAFPYATNRATIRAVGIRTASLLVRILAVGMFVIGVWLFYHG